MKRMLLITLVSLATISINISAKGAASSAAISTTVSQTVNSKELKGIVFDKITNESLAGAVITVNGQKVYTDLDGNFSVQNICNGKCQLKVSMISYADQTIDIDTKTSNKVQVKLQQR